MSRFDYRKGTLKPGPSSTSAATSGYPLPELTDADRKVMDSFPDDAVEHWWEGHRWIDGKRILDAADAVVKQMLTLRNEAAYEAKGSASRYDVILADRIARVIATHIGAEDDLGG